MLEWHDEAFVLARRRHGDSAMLVNAFTFEHGRHAGLVPGGGSRSAAHLWQPGNQVDLVWRARLSEHLGSFKGEPIRLHAADALDDPKALATLGSAMALVDQGMAERDPHPLLYAALVRLAERLDAEPMDRLAEYVRFELVLLAEAGFGLDLSACAVTGATEDLAFVSPRTGRAVAREAAGEWADRMLALPAFLLTGERPDAAQALDGLRLAGHFLEHRLFAALDRPVPATRDRLVDLLQPPASPDP